MNITKIINTLPDSAKADVEDFNQVKINLKGKSKIATRVRFDRLLTEDEITYLESKRNCSPVLECTYKYAPEIKKHYVYIW